MAATTEVRARRREQTRSEILAAAWQRAERDGVAGLSLRQVAAGDADVALIAEPVATVRLLDTRVPFSRATALR